MDFFDNHYINMKTSSHSPGETNVKCSESFNYWKRSLTQRIQSRIVLDNLPWEGDTKDFFYQVLLNKGYLAVFKNMEYGIAFQPCELYGYNFYYSYTNAIISNPVFQADFIIGEDCEIIKLSPDYRGVGDIVDFFASLLANATASLDVSIWNTRIPFLMYGKDKAGRVLLEKIYDRVSEGNPAVFFESEAKLNTEDSPIHIEKLQDSKTFISGELIKVVKELLSMFDSEIGIADITEKKERRITSEVEAEKDGYDARLNTWIDTLNNSLSKVNKKYNLNIIARKRCEDYVSDSYED